MSLLLSWYQPLYQSGQVPRITSANAICERAVLPVTVVPQCPADLVDVVEPVDQRAGVQQAHVRALAGARARAVHTPHR